ncbi:MAG: threonine synthase [Burkholderiales bacterium]|nr:threonine synthase [Burkholderiales bacterium]
MRYVSTRGGMAPARFTEILLEGLAPDGGLTVPEHGYPRLDAAELAAMRGLGYADLAFAVLSRFIDDIGASDLKRLIDATYTPAIFGSAAITPYTALEPGLGLLELSNGPTLAFKDMAMQLLGNLFEHVLARDGRDLNILGATSGDTGSAAEYAMRGKRGVRVFMLSPHGRMSPFQTAQMFSLADPNIYNIAIEGVFDDCQDIVKAIAGDAAFKARHRLGAVNSINWARVVAQVVYYFKGYFAATRGDGEEVSFAVPSGNFGNIYAGHVARMMGLPIRRLVLATNENNVLDEFFRTGAYRVRGSAETRQTSSPSMDISKASNFERFVHDLAGGDAAVVRALWQRVDAEGRFDLAGGPLMAALPRYGFVSGSSSHADRIATIRATHARYGRIIDTHTADGMKVALEQRETGVPMVVLETAQPAKFEDTIVEALGIRPPRPPGFAGIEALPRHFEVMPASAERVKAFVAAHAP